MSFKLTKENLIFTKAHKELKIKSDWTELYQHNLAIWLCVCNSLNIVYLNYKFNKYKCHLCGRYNPKKPEIIISSKGDLKILKKKYKKKITNSLFKSCVNNNKRKMLKKIGISSERRLAVNLKQKYSFFHRVGEVIDGIFEELNNKKIFNLLRTYPKTIDYIYKYNNKFNFIEVKTGGSKLSRHQKMLLGTLIDEGFDCWLYYSKNGCDDWKIINLNNLDFNNIGVLKEIDTEIEKAYGIDYKINDFSKYSIEERTKTYLKHSIKYWQKLVNRNKCVGYAFHRLELLYVEWRIRFGDIKELSFILNTK